MSDTPLTLKDGSVEFVSQEELETVDEMFGVARKDDGTMIVKFKTEDVPPRHPVTTIGE